MELGDGSGTGVANVDLKDPPSDQVKDILNDRLENRPLAVELSIYRATRYPSGLNNLRGRRSIVALLRTHGFGRENNLPSSFRRLHATSIRGKLIQRSFWTRSGLLLYLLFRPLPGGYGARKSTSVHRQEDRLLNLSLGCAMLQGAADMASHGCFQAGADADADLNQMAGFSIQRPRRVHAARDCFMRIA